jgi:nicotinamide-nucleotide amidase
MAEGAIRFSRADISVAITGVAGPGGGTAEKPVGLVHFAAANRDGATIHRERRFGDLGRKQIRLESVAQALELLAEIAGVTARS